MDEQRPTPEEMLVRARLEEEKKDRGRLKIYFGAAPGVGKTYAMLESAQARRREGGDVVIGWVETHGRAETERLTDGLERLPSRTLEYRGLTLREFDIDAAIARRPELLIVDELPHTNAPGSRHARRWQDVEELLGAGINVETTLNIQHLEGLGDIVAILTGIEVQETVPDRLLDQADEIELIDLPPEDLMQRLRDGKVYIPSQAARALENFFTPGNLTALRELVLRRTADRVGAKRSGLPAADPGAEESMLVVVDGTQDSGRVIRAAYRTARRLRARWIAVSVETPVFERLGPAVRERLSADLALAQRLGAETLVVRGERVSDEVLAVARQRRISRVVVPSPVHRSLKDRLFGGLAEQLVRAREVDVLVLRGLDDEAVTLPPTPFRTSTPLSEYGRALLVVAGVTALCWFTRSVFNLADQAMIYLLGVLLVASTLARGPSLMAAVVSVAALNFFFVPPFLTLAVNDARHIVTFAVLLVTAMLVSRQTLLIREQADASRERERRTVTLYLLTRQFAAAHTEGNIRDSVTRHLRNLFGYDTVLLLPDASGRLDAGRDAPDLTDRDLTVARWVFEHDQAAGSGTETLPGGPWAFLPAGAKPPIGIVGLRFESRDRPLSPSESQLLETAIGQTAAALQRIRTGERAESLRVAVETEKARNTLLSLVSHDLRTPLASIGGAAETLLSDNNRLMEHERRGLLESIRDETRRLGRLIGDILEITRLQSGGLALRRERYPLEELIDSALDQTEASLKGRSVQVRFPDEMVLIEADATVLTRVFVNLLDNVAKHTPAGTPVDVETTLAGSRVSVAVADRGSGIPPGEEERVFEMFHRNPGSGVPGKGLGLALSSAIARAHDGRIRAENRPGGGAIFIVELPLAARPAPVSAAEGA